jgi:hydrogenase nickel incorporation protein HypB
MEIVVAKDLLKANDQIAAGNRARFDAAGVTCVNLLGSPGSGKTTLLERLAEHLPDGLRAGAIEGDLDTSNDAERIQALGWPAVQINTGGGCHLDANMVAACLGNLDLAALDLVFVDNVGNLVCTASFQLGEHVRLVVLSVTEGDEKVVKYPPMFQKADVVVINKLDLLPHVDFDLERVQRDVGRVNPQAVIHRVSARTGEGVDALAAWLADLRGRPAGNRAAAGPDATAAPAD